MQIGSRIVIIDIMVPALLRTQVSMNVSIIPARPIPRRAVVITRDPKFDQLPTEKTLIIYNSKAIPAAETKNNADSFASFIMLGSLYKRMFLHNTP
jgi:hypothetical protein